MPGLPFEPPKHAIAERNKEPKPKSLKEVPGYVFRVVKSFFARLFYIFSLVWETSPWILILMVLIAILNGILPIWGAYIGAQIINELSLKLSGTEVLLSSIGLLFVYQFIYLFLNRINSDVNRILTSLSGELVSNHIRRKIMEKSKKIDIEQFDQPDFYEALENANREAGSRPIQILNSTLGIISTIITVVSFVVILLGISTWAPIVVGLLALPSAIINFVYRRKTVSYMRIRSKARRQMNYYSTTMVNKDLVKEIRLLGLGDDFQNRYDTVFADYFKGLKKLILSEGAWNLGVGLIRIVTNCFLFFFVASLVADGSIRIGDYSLYTGALNSIAAGVTNFVSATATIYEGTLFIDNLIAFMKQESRIVPSGPVARLPEKGIGHTIEFRHVSFRYPGSEKDVLTDINLTLEAGQTVALVGLNGAGKTTLIKLMTRLYDPTGGEILLDGRDIREYDVQKLYELFGIVFQDFGRYAVTVKENIRFGRVWDPENEAEIHDAAVQSDADSYIGRLPKNYDTPLMRYFEEDGTELSTGQWQKLAVARAFYSNADILILDEPTASLDAIAEQEIFRQFDQLRQGKTTLFVSHRLSSAVGADRIVVLLNGGIEEDGTHEQLMKRNGLYAEMFNAQAERYREGM